jgi:hypothetical protein
MIETIHRIPDIQTLVRIRMILEIRTKLVLSNTTMCIVYSSLNSMSCACIPSLSPLFSACVESRDSR